MPGPCALPIRLREHGTYIGDDIDPGNRGASSHPGRDHAARATSHGHQQRAWARHGRDGARRRARAPIRQCRNGRVCRQGRRCGYRPGPPAGDRHRGGRRRAEGPYFARRGNADNDRCADAARCRCSVHGGAHEGGGWRAGRAHRGIGEPWYERTGTWRGHRRRRRGLRARDAAHTRPHRGTREPRRPGAARLPAPGGRRPVHRRRARRARCRLDAGEDPRRQPPGPAGPARSGRIPAGRSRHRGRRPGHPGGSAAGSRAAVRCHHRHRWGERGGPRRTEGCPGEAGRRHDALPGDRHETRQARRRRVARPAAHTGLRAARQPGGRSGHLRAVGPASAPGHGRAARCSTGHGLPRWRKPTCLAGQGPNSI